MASFFENQQLARRNTRVMVVLFAVAVIAIVMVLNVVFGLFYVMLFRSLPGNPQLWGSLLMAGIILTISAVHVVRLAGGGQVVAQMMGARQVVPATSDPLERRLLNVVEEMSIASGVRVPGVYVLDGEAGINALAAGYDVSNSVVVVTRGMLLALNRDELQGVIGHEFSHILNGDIRLNIRMLGALAGIVFVGSIGTFIMRGAREADDIRSVIGTFLFGLLVFAVGYIGLFFARLIKAMVSRQREFLADASSVQFTRNPDGIAGALDQIRAAPAGTLIAGRHAEDMSHMFFGQGITVWLGSWFDTHPPLEERIVRVNARFDGTSYRKSRAAAVAATTRDGDAQYEEKRKVAAAAILGSAGLAGRRGADIGAQWGRSAGESAQLVGAMDGAKVDYAAKLLAALPLELRESLRTTDGARAAVVALLLAPKEEVQKQQLVALAAKGIGALGEQARLAEQLTRGLGPPLHMPVLDLALPAIKAASEAARLELVAALEAVIYADRRVSLHEFVVLTMVRSQLTPRRSYQSGPGASGNKRLLELQGAACILLSLVAHAGTRQDATGERGEAVAAAMRAGLAEAGLPAAAPVTALTLEAAAAALEMLKNLAPLQKAILVKALFATVSADGTIRVVEAELMRLVGAVLDCPLPPLLEAVDPATLAA